MVVEPLEVAGPLTSQPNIRRECSDVKHFQRWARGIVLSWKWKVALILAVVVDVVRHVCMRWFLDRRSMSEVALCAIFTTRLTVSLLFLADVVLKITMYGRLFFSKPLCIFDMSVSVLCLLAWYAELKTRLFFASSSDDNSIFDDQEDSKLNAFRAIATALSRCRDLSFLMKLPCRSVAKHVVSQNKRRFHDFANGFDLDLTYIVRDRVIAMGVPCRDWDLSLVYRNQISDVVRFFETRHKGGYLIVNACPELPYWDAEFAQGSIVKFDVQDHSPPTLVQILRFLKVASRHMGEDCRNVLAVHCKGGKGRTGCFIVAWLLFRGEEGCKSLEDAKTLFASRRSDSEYTEGGGVETPSQLRYLKYFASLLDCSSGGLPQLPAGAHARLRRLRLCKVWRGQTPKDLIAAVHLRGSEGGSRIVHWTKVTDSADGDFDLDLQGTQVAGDARVSIFDWKRLKRVGFEDAERSTCLAGEEPGCLFTFMFHVSFLEGDRLTVPVSELDKAWKKKKVYLPEGCVVMTYSLFKDDEELAF